MSRFMSLIASLCALFVFPLMLSLSSPAYAVDVFPACNPNTGNATQTDVCKSIPNPGTPNENPIIKLLKLTILILSFIIGVTSVIMIIVSGMWFITANGDPQAIARARSSIIYALIGLIVVVLAQSLVALVLNKL